ncbi:glycosyltransferase family 4 protein [Kineococcus sp. NPDC059986]|uniref:glycosyltransferase family 4 protein n=1 Tax=Kineococcus sp. NPDC059986 TaxID=3155538 RepID=UPI00344D3F2E
MSGRTVLVLARSLPLHHAGGMESVTWDLCRALTARGVDVVAVTTHLPGLPAEFHHDGVRVRALAGTTPGRYSRSWWSASRTAVAADLVRGTAGLLSVSAGGFGALGLARAAGVRTVLQAHGTSVDEIVSKLGARRVRSLVTLPRNVSGLAKDVVTYRGFDEVVAVGPRVERSLTRFPLGPAVAMPPVHLVENGVDTDVFRPDPVVRERVRADLAVTGDLFVVVGRLHPQKRVDRSVRLLTRFPAATLVLAGDGPDRPALADLARDLGVQDRVRFLGAVDRARVPGLLAAGDVSLLTSQWREGLPMAVLESLACGTPAVTSLTTAPVAGADVPRVDAADPDELAAGVRRVLDRHVGGSSLLPERYSLTRVAARYAELLGAA